MIKTIILDDHSATSAGIKFTLEKSGYFKVLKVLPSPDELLDYVKVEKPNLIVSDISMPGMNIFGQLKELKMKYSDLKVVIYSVHKGEGYFRDALEMNVDGYILKAESLEYLPFKIMDAYKGNKYYSTDLLEHFKSSPISFTEKEHELIRLILSGKISDEIAFIMNISKRTVEFHLDNIKSKFGLKKTQELIIELVTKYYL